MGKWWFNGDLWCFNGIYPLVNKHSELENGHRNSGFSHRKWWFSIAMLNYQRVPRNLPRFLWMLVPVPPFFFGVAPSRREYRWCEHHLEVNLFFDIYISNIHVYTSFQWCEDAIPETGFRELAWWGERENEDSSMPQTKGFGQLE